MTPLVTIVVISYNHSRYIKENLDSIKKQTHPNIQLIVADDASSDNSVEVFEEWLSDNNYPALKNYHKKNKGLATTLNECIELAKGKYIKLIAADDYLHPDAIADCVAKMEEIGESCVMTFSDIFTIDEKNKYTKAIKDYHKNKYIDSEGKLDKQSLLTINSIIAPSTLIRLEALKNTGSYSADLILEDHERWLKLSDIGDIFFISKKLAYYRVLETSITNTRHERMIVEDIYLRMHYDYEGINKNFIENLLLNQYSLKKNIDPLLIKAYKKYPYKVKRLALALHYNIPFSIYSLINKFL